MRRRWLLAVLLVLASGCAATASTASGYRAADQQQSGQCDGVPRPATLSLIAKSANVTGAVACEDVEKYVQHQGLWNVTVVRQVPPAQIPALVAGLTLPDEPATGGACTAILIVVGSFVLTLADGSRIRPGVPGDGCHPRQAALAALDGLSGFPIKSQTRTVRVRTDLEVTTNCGSTAKSPAIWLDATKTEHARSIALPRTGSISVCRYRGTADQQGTLVAAGLRSSAAMLKLWPHAVDVSPSGCHVPPDVMQTPPMEW